jgi:hypothetical protein
MPQYAIYSQEEYPPHGRAWHLVDVSQRPPEGAYMTLCRNLLFRPGDGDRAIPADEWQRNRGAEHLCSLCEELGGSSANARAS